MSLNSHDAGSEKLRAENDDLRRRLEEAEDALRAIREGEVDAIIVSGSKGDRVFSLAGSENLHRIMVETMNEAGIATSPDGTILYCNHRACALLQRAASEIVGQHLSEIVAPQHLDRVSLMLDNASRGTTHDRIMFLAADESPVPMQLWASRAETLEGPMITLVGTDLSMLEADRALLAHLEEQQNALQAREQELKESHLDLEEKVKQRTLLLEERGEKLRAMAEALTTAEQEERRRLAQVLHDDLQQMLVAIRLRLASLESSVAGTPLTPAVRSISEIVDNAITSSRSLTMELSPPILRESLADIIAWLANWFETRHDVRVDVQNDGVAEPSGEAKKFLFQAMRELILNVRKHAGVDRVHVRVFAAGDDVGIEVRDGGRGFNPEEVRNNVGASFGLFNIRERVELLGGALEIQSAPERGTTCTIRVPVGRTPAGETGNVAAPAIRESGPIRVLVVDDHTIFRRGLISILENYPDIKVVGEASDGEEGVRQAGELLPDVVIMDLAMPRMNGIEATRVIKSRFMSVDVIALSFQESEHARTTVLQAGARAYFTKSGPLDQLLRAIRAHEPGNGRAAAGDNDPVASVPPVRPKEQRRANNPLRQELNDKRPSPRTRKA